MRLDQLVSSVRLITVTGPGGVGKTRLVRELLERRGDDAARTGLLAGLRPGADEDLVADALGFESVDGAVLVLSERPSIIVLDGCEHVVEGVRRFVETLRGTVPAVGIVVTSREPLGIRGEHVYVLGPLSVPSPGGADAELSPSVALFLDRAAAAGAVPPRDAQTLSDVGELCRRLDGLPLAIELAVARSRALAPADLLSVVDRRLDLLHGPAAVPGTRHDSMRAAIEVSTALLAPAEHRFFRRLGTFTGPFDVGLAHEVVAEPGADRQATVDLMTQLVERSLVVAEPAATAHRYRLLQLLREHALEDLRAADEVAATEERFVDAMVETADGIVAGALTRWEPNLLTTASTQFANLVRAVEICLQVDRTPERSFRLLLPMFGAVHESRPHDVWALGSRVFERWPAQPAPWRSEVQAVLATAAALAGLNDEVEPLAITVVDDPTSSTLARAIADRAWGLATRRLEPLTAAHHFGLARRAAARAGIRFLEWEVTAFEAGELDLAGDRDRALALLADVLREGRDAGDLFVVVLGHLVRARVLLRAGDVAGAATDVESAQRASAEMGAHWWSSALLRTEATAISLGPGGWAVAAPRWRQAVDDAASRGELGEVAITLRAAAATALHLGQQQAADVLAAAVPRSAAVTVLPELFPEEAAQLAARATTMPSGTSLVDALARARRALGEPASPVLAETPADPHGGANELVLEGESWRVRFHDKTVRVRDMKGIADLAVLIARPGVEIHVLELMGGHDVGSEAGPLLDQQARRAYQVRIIDLQRNIDAARADHDPNRADRAEAELDALVEQLSEAFGLGGRSRATGASAERARSAVTYRIRAAIRKLDSLHPELGRHLANAVRTGTWCSYRPEGDVPWRLDRSPA